MDDLIRRQDVIDALDIKPFEDYGDYETALEVIKDVPSAQHRDYCYLDSPCPYQNEEIKVMQKKGHWIYPTDVKGFCRCEHCGALWGRDLYENRFFKYCPRCGADMREETES